MSEIRIYIKNQAAEKDTIRDIASISSNDISIKLTEEEQLKEPIVSKAALGANEITQIIDASKNLLSAESIVHLVADSIFPLILIGGYKKTKEFLKFILSNNKKKGNKIGVKVTIEREVKERKCTYDFICDGIPESELSKALENVNSTLDNLHVTLGEEYFNVIKHIIFMYDTVDSWKIKAIEKFESIE